MDKAPFWPSRAVSRIMRAGDIDGAVIGGVAGVLHGHVRTTLDVDVYVPEPVNAFADLLKTRGFQYEARKRQFVKRGALVHLVTVQQLKSPPWKIEQIDRITTVSLADLPTTATGSVGNPAYNIVQQLG
jgi:hypothetical protein